MKPTEDKPVDREAWRRLLDADGEGPPELTDARIRAKARQAFTPRTGRWWLPASLAASLLLAVLIVQWQYERPRAPMVVSESDYAAATAEGPAAQRQDESLAAQPSPQEGPATATPGREGYQANEATTAITARTVEQRAAEAGTDAERDAGFVAPPPPVMPPPLIDLPQMEDSRPLGNVVATAPPADAAPAPTTPAPAAKREEDVSEIVVSGSRIQEDNLEATTPVTQVTSADVTTQGVSRTGALMKSGEVKRSPEEWYAEIEKLRAAGKKREAKRELKKLEEAHPGWLEKNHPTDR